MSLKIQDNSEKYDIETLTGNESEVVEMVIDSCFLSSILKLVLPMVFPELTKLFLCLDYRI